MFDQQAEEVLFSDVRDKHVCMAYLDLIYK